MQVDMIDAKRIQSMIAQLKAATRPEQGMPGVDTNTATTKTSFADALKTSLDQVSKVQQNAEQLGERFALGDDKVSLSDVMISSQKANIAFQATVQVRNKLVSAYHDIMNMQI